MTINQLQSDENGGWGEKIEPQQEKGKNRGRLESRSFRSPFEDLIKPRGVMQIKQKCYEKAHLFNQDYIMSESNCNPFKVDVLSPVTHAGQVYFQIPTEWST